jgi:hypothetical protein
MFDISFLFPGLRGRQLAHGGRDFADTYLMTVSAVSMVYSNSNVLIYAICIGRRGKKAPDVRELAIANLSQKGLEPT